ncbi:hypothetical protein MRX96_028068 [Rhipicephalus microplus]
MLRWSILLNVYSYPLVHRPGKKAANADALNRLSSPMTVRAPPPLLKVFMLELTTKPLLQTKDFAVLTQWDLVLCRVLSWAHGDWLAECLGGEFQAYEQRQHQCTRGASYGETVPKLKHLAVGAQALSRSYVWWPKTDADIEHKVNVCSTCQASRPDHPQAPVHNWERTKTP